MSAKKIMLAETHQTFVGAVRHLLQKTMGTMLMVADERSLIEALTDIHFDLVIADLSFPVASGGNIARLLQKLKPELKCIILSVHDEEPAVRECLAAGAKGFVLKRTAASDLVPAVEAVVKGGTYFSPFYGFSIEIGKSGQAVDYVR